MSVSASTGSAAEATVLVLYDTHDLKTFESNSLWPIGFVPIYEDGNFFPEEDHHVSGVSCRRPNAVLETLS
jgi:hypothetical protein